MATLTQIEMYSEFRKELDKMCVPFILKESGTRVHNIYCDGKAVGLFCVRDHNFFNYIDCVYIQPEYRRKGIAKNAVLSWYKKHSDKPIHLHILNNNKPAKAFWNGLFVLEEIEHNSVDTLYRVVSLKEE